MSITHYTFDNANPDGDKEPVVVPNTPTLINKLSANETNNFKDKLNEVIDSLNATETVVTPAVFTAPITGAGQTFSPVTFQANNVFVSKGVLYKGSEWTQTGDTITIIKSINSGNTIYITP